MHISVVIPVLDEESAIVAGLAALAGEGADEVVVVDGGSRDATVKRARAAGARVIESPRGRGVQQNRGAAAVGGDVLVFLHADCLLEPGALGRLRRFARDHPRVPGGCFRMRVEARDRVFRAIDGAADLRAGLLGVPYGDQGIFATRAAFERVGGFPEVPLMEDVLFALALRRLGRLAVVPARIHVSPRRWRHRGIVRQSLRNWALTVGGAAGVPLAVLARFYPVVR